MGKIKVGVFGLIRGHAFIKGVLNTDDAEIVAVCDKNPQTLEEIRNDYGDAFKYCSTFEELLDTGMYM